MTPEEMARLINKLFPLCDSPIDAEAEAALHKLRKMGLPTLFGDIARKLQSTVTPEQLEESEKNSAQLKKALDERAEENTALRRANTILVSQVASLRSALWFSVNFKHLAVAGAVLTLGYGLWHWTNAEASPGNQAASNVTADGEHDLIDPSWMRSILNQTKWAQGDTPPVAWRVNGVDHWWVVVRGSTDSASHADTLGRPIERHCLKIYATRAVPDAGAFIAPQPYRFFGKLMNWPERAAECRLPGSKGY